MVARDEKITTMLRIEELVKAIDLAQAIGQRPYGHFDHDARCFTGPAGNRNAVFTEGYQATAKSQQSCETEPRYETFEDPDTGEVLYRAVK